MTIYERNPYAYAAAAYFTALPRVVYRTTLSCLLNPKKAMRFSQEVLHLDDLMQVDPVLGTVKVEELFPAAGDVTLRGPYYLIDAAETRILQEIASVAHVVSSISPKLIFEFGTFIGRMTRTLAMNAPNSSIITIDLPQEKVTHRIGKDFAETPEASRIQQLAGDSRTFDYSQWLGACDFVWVDACHDYEFVVADTAHALRLCKPGGWIAWHDYRHTAWWSGVTRPVRDVRDRFEVIRHLRGTTIAIGRLKAN